MAPQDLDAQSALPNSGNSIISSADEVDSEKHTIEMHVGIPDSGHEEVEAFDQGHQRDLKRIHVRAQVLLLIAILTKRRQPPRRLSMAQRRPTFWRRLLHGAAQKVGCPRF